MNDTHEPVTATPIETAGETSDESKILDVDELAMAVGGAIVVQPASPPPPPPPPEDYPCC